MGKYPKLSRSLSILPAEYIETAIPQMEVSSTRVAANISPTKVIPRGACQFPELYVRMPSFQIEIMSCTAITKPTRFPMMLIVFCHRLCLQKKSMTIAKNNWFIIGYKMMLSVMNKDLLSSFGTGHLFWPPDMPFLSKQWQRPVTQN